MKQTVILANYIDVGDIPHHEVQAYMEQVINKLQHNPDDTEDINIKQYFIPVRDQETRVECVYPIAVTSKYIQEKYESVLEKLNTYTTNIINTLDDGSKPTT